MKILRYNPWECQGFTVRQNIDSVLSLVVGIMDDLKCLLCTFFVSMHYLYKEKLLPLNAVLRRRSPGCLLTFFWKMLTGEQWFCVDAGIWFCDLWKFLPTPESVLSGPSQLLPTCRNLFPGIRDRGSEGERMEKGDEEEKERRVKRENCTVTKSSKLPFQPFPCN